jgi:hypothetical protein
LGSHVNISKYLMLPVGHPLLPVTDFGHCGTKKIPSASGAGLRSAAYTATALLQPWQQHSNAASDKPTMPDPDKKNDR